MSKGGFSISAAHAGQPRRAMYLEQQGRHQLGKCVQTLACRVARPHMCTHLTQAWFDSRQPPHWFGTGTGLSTAAVPSPYWALQTWHRAVRHMRTRCEPAEQSVRTRWGADILSRVACRCSFRDYIHDCIGNVCPRQISHTYPDTVEAEWTAGDY